MKHDPENKECELNKCFIRHTVTEKCICTCTERVDAEEAEKKLQHRDDCPHKDKPVGVHGCPCFTPQEPLGWEEDIPTLLGQLLRAATESQRPVSIEEAETLLKSFIAQQLAQAEERGYNKRIQHTDDMRKCAETLEIGKGKARMIATTARTAVIASVREWAEKDLPYSEIGVVRDVKNDLLTFLSTLEESHEEN